MANLNGFDASQVAPQVAFEAIPAGDYLATISDSVIEQTKDGAGHFLKLTLQILDGPHKGRKLSDRLNLKNKNQQAVDIARATLSAICHAVGVMQPRDSHELHNLPLIITVKCAKRKDTGDITNEIRGYKSKNAAAPSIASQNGAATQSSSRAPWQR